MKLKTKDKIPETLRRLSREVDSLIPDIDKARDTDGYFRRKLTDIRDDLTALAQMYGKAK